MFWRLYIITFRYYCGVHLSRQPEKHRYVEAGFQISADYIVFTHTQCCWSRCPTGDVGGTCGQSCTPWSTHYLL